MSGICQATNLYFFFENVAPPPTALKPCPPPWPGRAQHVVVRRSLPGLSQDQSQTRAVIDSPTCPPGSTFSCPTAECLPQPLPLRASIWGATGRGQRWGQESKDSLTLYDQNLTLCMNCLPRPDDRQSTNQAKLLFPAPFP